MGRVLFRLAIAVFALAMFIAPAALPRTPDRPAGGPAAPAPAPTAAPPVSVGIAKADRTRVASLGVECPRERKRLWVEGEGWIVRRVTTCH